jgi:radical SAM superfamily enzyme YgiQ (UPF0313 family)
MMNPAAATPEFLVSGVHTIIEYPPIALGMCMTYARRELAGNVRIEISRHLLCDEQQLVELLQNDQTAKRRHILLFSNYLWNRKANLHLSLTAKRIAPDSITIHGGPDTPAYSEASRDFLMAEPHVDFIVAGEGEETLKELLAALTSGHAGPIDVEGLRYFHRGQFVETAPRTRAKDLGKFPSPYLEDFFAEGSPAQWQTATIETYRGCPYSCTFCDWGSNIASKIRTFELRRVFDEIEWIAKRRVRILWIADSNFGMFERDIEITRKVCEISQRYGFPKAMVLTFAKNVKSRVVDIVQLMAESDLIGTGIISLQTTDPETLRIIRRSNIKTSEYEKLRHAFANRGLPLNVELMMALPGATLDAFKRDLLYHFDMPIEVSVNRTIMLTNSPMADPAYRREHQIEVDEESRITKTATMSAADIEVATVICRVFYGVHRFGILRFIMRWLQWELKIDPLDVIEGLVRESEELADYPALRAMLHDARMGTPFDLITALVSFREEHRQRASWATLSEQFISWVSQRYGFAADDTLHELGRIQARLMPAAGREFPEIVNMRHDLVAWYADWLDGHGAALSDYGLGVLRVDDPCGLSNRPCIEGMSATQGHTWELDFALGQVRRERAKWSASDARDTLRDGGDHVEAQ